MKKKIINKCMRLIKDCYPQYDDIRLAEIEYGLVGIYLTITKSIVIFLIAYCLGIFKELILFMIFYNFIRMPTFGLHASSSISCLIASTVIFLTFPILCNFLVIPVFYKWIIGVICILFIAKNAPADTHKRPIIDPNRRMIYRLISTNVAILFTILSFTITNHFISNSLIGVLIIQTFMTAPSIYKLFQLPYHNYKRYHKQCS